MAIGSIRLLAAGFGLNLLCFITTAVWKQPVVSGERIVVICFTCVCIAITYMTERMHQPVVYYVWQSCLSSTEQGKGLIIVLFPARA